MNNPIYIIKNGSLQKAGDINAQLLPGDLIRYNSKFYKVLYRAVEAKSNTNEMAYIVEEFNPLAQ